MLIPEEEDETNDELQVEFFKKLITFPIESSADVVIWYSGCGCSCGYIVTMAKLNYGHILLLIDRLSDALVSSLKPTPVKISHEREGEKD